MYGHSSMRLVRLADGKVLDKTAMGSQWFGEGTTRLGDKLYQVTWLSGAGFIYSVPDLNQVWHCSTQLATARLMLHVAVTCA
jgi:glutamine cyclotransferase